MIKRVGKVGRAALHRGSILASHLMALGSVLSIPGKKFRCRLDLLAVLVRGKWTEAWKCHLVLASGKLVLQKEQVLKWKKI